MKKLFLVLTVFSFVMPLTTHGRSHAKKHHNHLMRTKHKEQAVITTAVAKEAPLTTTPCWLNNVSGSMALVTNYMFRGISQSSNHPAAQGGLTYTFPIGLYFSAWGSSVKFTAPNGATATSEQDSVVGWQGNAGEDFSYNLSLARYNYPGARYANYNEFLSIFTYSFLQVGVAYTANYSGTHASGTYYNGVLSFALPQKFVYLNDLQFQAGMGHYSLARAAGFSYNDYVLTLNKKVNDTYTASLQWTGTNHRAQQAPYDENQVLGMITATI